MKIEMLQKEMVAAMKARDKLRKDTISALVANIKKAAIDEKCRNDIPEELVDKVILKERKTVQEMISTCPADREELLVEYTCRLDIINEFVPTMMTEEEVRKFIANEIAANSQLETGNKGIIMKHISPKLKGKADMKMVNAIVTEICGKVG